MRRKLFLLTAAIAVCAVVVLATLPWWLGVALAMGGGRFGLTFGEYRRIGYTRFVLNDAEVRRPGVRVTVSRVELSTPLLWLFAQPGSVMIDRWNVIVMPVEASPAKQDRPKGWRPLRTRLDQVIDGLERWLPPATAGAGEVVWPGAKLQLAAADWRAQRLQVTGLAWREQVADVMIFREQPGRRLRVEARSPQGKWEASLESDGPQLAGRGRWWGQPVLLDARFAETGWLPVEAKVEAADWHLTAARVKLNGFYDTIAGRADLTWHEGRLLVDVHAQGNPRASGEAPPLFVRLHGSGGLDRWSFDRLDVQMPGIQGHLSEPVIFGRDGRLLSGPSRFELAVDLEKQPWFEGRGSVTGVVDVTPQGDRMPLVNATLAAANAAVADWVATKAEAEAYLEWPRLRVSTASVKLADGDELVLGGEWDIRARTLVDGRAQGRVRRETVSRWLTKTGGFENIAFDVTAAGPWPRVEHKGRAKVEGLHVPPLRPLVVELEWKGTGRALDSAVVNAVAGGTRLQARGAVAEESARIDELVLTQAGTERLRLSSPVRVQWKPELMLDEFQLRGSQGDVAGRLAWGNAGAMKLDVKNIESTWLDEVVDLPGPAWSVTTLMLDGDWNGGPLSFTASGVGGMKLNGGQRAEFVVSAHGDSQGMHVETLQASMNQQGVVRAMGSLPISVYPLQTPFLRVDENAPVSFEAITEPNAFFWEQLSAMTGLAITDPAVRVTLTGTMRNPTGEGTMRIGKITALSGAPQWRSLPEIDHVDARLTVNRGGVGLEVLTLHAAGQPVRATGRLPVTQWTALLKDPLNLAEAEGEIRIEIPDADVAALARYAPAYLAPTGKLQVDVAFKQGGQLQGVIRLKDAVTRPLGPLGILQSVGAEIALNGRTVEVKEVHASMGGQPVTLSGKVELPDGKEPRLDLALRGEKLPFVRQAGLLVRGDLDLRIVTDDNAVTRITGATRLRESLFLMDVRALLPSGGARNAPGRRPPYFVVEAPPFDEWQLDVTVDGDRFLRLRTPVFAGLASAHFRLRGTLGDPRATGEAVINQGQVLFPFATFAVRQGEVRLTEANPFEPTISLMGTSRRYGYDLRMEMSGTVEKPLLTFSSTPALESEQVLLMVMAGEAPQNEVTYTGRQRAARLGTYLGQSLLGQLGADPSGSERLSVTVGERVSRRGRETYGVEYELTPRWSLVGEYDEFDDYNVGVKWRVFSEKKAEEEANAQKK